MSEPTGNLKDGGMGGSLPDTAPAIKPIETFVEETGNTGPTPFSADSQADLDAMQKANEGGTDKPQPSLKPEEKPQPEIDPNTGQPVEPDYTEAEYIADRWPHLAEKGYQTVAELVADLDSKSTEFEGQFGKINPIYDKLNKIATKLGVEPDKVLDALDALDPRSQASPESVPETDWTPFEQFLTQSGIEPQYHDVYRAQAGAILKSIMPTLIAQVESRFGRTLRGYDSKFDGIELDMRLDRYMANDKNADKRAMRQQIRDALLDRQSPTNKWLGKPNDIDLVAKFLMADKPQVSTDKRVKDATAKAVQQIEARKRQFHMERSGRAPTTGVKPTEPSQMNLKQLGAMIDELERQGKSPA